MNRTVCAALAAFAAFAGSPALAAPAGKNCRDIWQHGTYASGYYEIEPRDGQIFTVWCEMAGDTREYLPLCKTGGDHNFGQYTVGGLTTGTSVRTSFTRVRIDPNAMLLDVNDLTFATSTGTVNQQGTDFTSMALGVAADCNGAQTGRANIDLNGTPFTIVNSAWFLPGYAPAGSVSVDGNPAQALPAETMLAVTGKSVDVTGGGNCGVAGPYGFNSNAATWFNPTEKAPAVKLLYTGPQTCVP